MSSMAGEIANRMADDGIDSGQKIVPGAPSDGRFGEVAPDDGAPGNVGRVPPAQQAPSAGTQTTDTPVGQGEPGPIPYARFKEVNDQLRGLQERYSGYEQLSQYGYDPDSLGRLANFDAAYAQDPRGAILALVNHTDDLPQDTKTALAALLGQAPSSGDGDLGGDEDEQPSRLTQDERDTLAWARSRQEQEALDAQDHANKAALDQVVNIWTTLDQNDNLRDVPERRKLLHIQNAVLSGEARTYQELAELARKDYYSDLEQSLGEVVLPGGRRESVPPTLPGGPSSAAPAVRPMKTMKDARRAIMADMEAGRLPSGLNLPDVGG